MTEKIKDEMLEKVTGGVGGENEATCPVCGKTMKLQHNDFGSDYWKCACGENQYIGKGEGKSTVPMTVRVTMVDGDITDVEILEDWETPGFTDRAKEQTIAQIIEKDDAIVDVISGATMTSVGIMNAVYDALENGK